MAEIIGKDITMLPGIVAAGMACGIKKSGELDLALIFSRVSAVAAGMFTTNRIAAAPVQLSKQKLRRGRAQAIIINSGNANACTGENGKRDCQRMAEVTAGSLGISPSLVLVSSTGIIGERLPMALIERGIQILGERIKREDCLRGGEEVARAIMTTDTFPKQKVVEVYLDNKKIKIGGIAKGAGMICPQLATMLCFLVTDATISRPMLVRSLKESVDLSFNRISIDGVTSTNDMVLILANGLAGNEEIRRPGEAYLQFTRCLSEVTESLARMIIQDGEGATKFVEILVQGARTRTDARKVAFSVANSNLVKTALYGGDPNWGRIMAAIGISGVRVVAEKINIQIGGVPLVFRGQKAPTSGTDLHPLFQSQEIFLTIDLGLGNKSYRVWTCDLSPEYVHINACYHT